MQTKRAGSIQTSALKCALLSIVCLLSGCSNPYYKGTVSKHFDGKKFHNYSTTLHQQTLVETLKWIVTGTKVSWPSCCVPTIQPKLLNKVAGDRVVVTYLSHATTLIQANGLNILTDPVWSDRVGPFSVLGPKRVSEMPISIEDLPPIDVILVSHNHYDHLDISTLRKLVALYSPKIFTGLGVETYLKTKGIGAVGMDWWETFNLNKKVRITYTPSQHWSSRWGWDKNYTLWGSFMIDIKDFGQVFFGGDTGYNQTYFDQIRAKFPNIKLALLPIGAYKPRWFMAYAHLDPNEAVQASIALGSQRNIAIHHDIFNLANESYGEASKDLAAALKARGKSSEYFQAILPGESIALSTTQAT